VKDTLQQIRVLVDARYPVLQLVTHEETRVEREIVKMVQSMGRGVYKWRLSDGLKGGVAPTGFAGTQAPGACLATVADVEEPAIFIFFDLHRHFDDPEVVRRIRDLCQLFGTRGQVMVMIGSDLLVPQALQKDVVTIDVPFPQREEVGRLLAVLLKSQKIDVPSALFERFVEGSLGLTEEEIKRLYARILLDGAGFTEDDLKALIEEKRRVIRQSRVLEFWESAGLMDDVGGMDSLKEWLEQRSKGFSSDAKAFGLPEPKGLFLLGVQGCGKSLMSKAVADLWRLPLLRLDVAAVFQSVGSEAENLRETIRVAEGLAPVVLWIDEIEKGFLGSSNGGGGKAFGYFLTWMQEKTKPVFVVATANEVRSLPPELLRKGRFDEIFFVDLPNVHERLAILEIHLRRRGRDPEMFDLTSLAEDTERFSGAELEQLVIAGLFSAFHHGRELDNGDLVEAGREIIPLAVTMDDRLKELREWARPRARPASLERRRIDYFNEWDQLG